ncbi:MAG UNVERIFIED_CONTAM: hypothetical protein LVT10_13745 [Anaerolineae bacterium]|jgi:hypothetical protein
MADDSAPADGSHEPVPGAPDDPGDAEVGARSIEIAVALVLMALAAVVIADSLRIGAGWADDGPQAGYFPFYIGLAMLAGQRVDRRCRSCAARRARAPSRAAASCAA